MSISECLVPIEGMSSGSDNDEGDTEEAFLDDYTFRHIPSDGGHFYYCAFSKELANKPVCKPVILTFHDVGFNSCTSFESLFAHPKMRSTLQQFSILHVSAPGQEMFAKSLEKYPTLDQIADAISQIVAHFGINEFVGFGVGTGANILIRFARKYPELVNGLFLSNFTNTPKGWLSSLKDRTIAHILSSDNKPSQLLGKFALRQYWRSRKTIYSGHASAHYTHPAFNVHNFALFLNAHLNQSKLNLKTESLTCPVLLMASQYSSSLDDTIEVVSKLNPAIASYLRVDDSIDAMQDKQKIVADALSLFLQGLGYIPRYRLRGIVPGGDQFPIIQ